MNKGSMNLPPPQALLPEMNVLMSGRGSGSGYFQMPQLVVKQQNSLSEEKYTTKSGAKSTQMVHVVVKNSPFVISLGLLNNNAVRPDIFGKYMTNNGIDMSKLTFDCKLLYDTEGPDTEVDYISNKPFLFKVVAADGGQQIDVEVRLKVLSSQHEDMFFRVKFMALDPINKQEVSPSLTVLSAPIKVISKPEQLKKRRPSKKRTLNDALIESLNRIERKQHDQQKLIDKLLEGEFEDLPSPAPVPYIPAQLQQQQQQGQQSEDGSDPSANPSEAREPVDFGTAVSNLLHKYSALPEEERPKKIQKLLANANVSRDNLTELNDLFLAEGMQQAVGKEADGEGGQSEADRQCTCPACPHKMELERIELFYKDVFHL